MLSVRMAIVAAAVGVPACAADAWNNRSATGFDAIVDRVSRACSPLQYGMHPFASPNAEDTGGSSYDIWLDLTTRLYDGPIGTGAYAEGLNATFGDGSQGTINCTLR